MVIGGLDAPRRSRRGTRRARAADPAASAVEVTRATVVDPEPLADPDTWLAGAAGPEAEATLARALAVLNRALHARRIAAADPLAGEADLARALVARVGYGAGEEVADGAWTTARELPTAPPRAGRDAALRPQERFAALLSARDAALACELLALRARADLDHGRDREAALQLEAALAVAREELAGWRELDGMPERLAELAALADGVGAVAATARLGGVDDAARAAVAHALARLEAALRARTAGARF